MASPEYSSDLPVAAVDISQKLEIADEIENPIERFHKRNDLLEQYDDLQAEIDTTPSPDNLPNEKQP